MIKKVSILSFMFIIFFSFLTPFLASAAPNATAPNAILIDYKTGEVLFEKNAHTVTYPASTTKVMTAILALENANLDDVVTIDYDLHVGGAGMYLVKGEAFTVEEFLNVLLIRSANDVAEALAIHISGSVEEFADLMNERARELGALNTNFTNPHGMPDENHVTTAYDLAMIGRHAMSFDLFREIVSNGEVIQFEPTEFFPETRYYRNTNRFLWGTGGNHQMLYNGSYVNIKYDIIDGIKTGYTNAAQQCLIASGIKDDHRLISVVLGAQGVNIYSDTRSLIDYGHDNYQLLNLVSKGNLQTDAYVQNGVESTVPLYTNEDLYTVLPISTNTSEIKEEIILSEDITAPILQGADLGTIVYSMGDKTLGEVTLVAGMSVETTPLIKKALQPKTIAISLIILFVLWQGIVIYLRLKRKRIRRLNLGGYSTSYKSRRNILDLTTINSSKKRK